jgi:hypothetical protein
MISIHTLPLTPFKKQIKSTPNDWIDISKLMNKFNIVFIHCKEKICIKKKTHFAIAFISSLYLSSFFIECSQKAFKLADSKKNEV